MGDSDDEFDRRRRDKFRRERSDMERSREREERRRDDWPDRYTHLTSLSPSRLNLYWLVEAYNRSLSVFMCVTDVWISLVQGLGPRQREEEGLRSWSQREVFSTSTHQPSTQTHEERLVSCLCVFVLAAHVFYPLIYTHSVICGWMFSGMTTGGSRTATTCPTEEGLRFQGRGLRAGILTSPTFTPTTEVIHFRAGEPLPPTRGQSSRSSWSNMFLVSWTWYLKSASKDILQI